MSAFVPVLFDAVYGIVPAMAIVDFVAILALGKYARAVWRDYRRQRIAEPVFARHPIPALAHVPAVDVWGEHRPLPQRAADPRVAARES
ncbi:hypothetical protein WJ03_15320 [Burkholderia vietnamiensis]|nr:hypothetical protein WJ03_15320 [Burkholderia vietnamiensis]